MSEIVPGMVVRLQHNIATPWAVAIGDIPLLVTARTPPNGGCSWVEFLAPPKDYEALQRWTRVGTAIDWPNNQMAIAWCYLVPAGVVQPTIVWAYAEAAEP